MTEETTIPSTSTIVDTSNDVTTTAATTTAVAGSNVECVVDLVQQQQQQQQPALLGSMMLSSEKNVVVVGLKFVPFSSRIESSFWVRYCRMKLDTIRLNEAPIRICVTYGVNNNTTNTISSSTGSNNAPLIQCHDHSLLLSSISSSSSAAAVGVEGSHDINIDGTNTTKDITQNLHHMNECVHVQGHFIGYNTLETFQTTNKNILLHNYFIQQFFPSNATTTASDSDDDTIDQQVLQSLNCTIIISYADLKNHTILYWFGFPVLVPKSQSIVATRIIPSITTSNFWDQLEQSFYQMRYQQLSSLSLSSSTNIGSNTNQITGLIPYFIYCTTTNKCVPLSRKNYQSILGATTTATSTGTTAAPLDDIYFGYFDPLLLESDVTTSDPNSATNIPYMGWPIRNMIAYLSFYCQLGNEHVNIISYRPTIIRRIDITVATTTNTTGSSCNDVNHSSILLKVRIPTKEEYTWTTTPAAPDTSSTSTTTSSKPVTILPQYKVVGWELNQNYKPGPRLVNLRPLLDNNHLAIQAADLNLKLMKWRMIPDLQVNVLQSTKVLLIGAGTLGCNVARILLGWGVRDIKIIDYGKVSYSNPVRQSLFTLSDCYSSDNGGGLMKAIAAANALQSITPDVVSEGIVLSIPMPGHSDTVDVIHNAVSVLDTLIQQVDVVYLLTDTRESRWLPTVMCTAYNKVLINAALGLDSWLVMRHGPNPSLPLSSTDDGMQQENNVRLGCYFCSDVVAPENSMKNRTLDQQCTVTRPGLAYIASSMAVELMVSLLHHPKRIAAPAPKNSTASSSNTQFSPILNTNDESINGASSTLGIIPHSIRGSLVTYTMMTPTIPAFQYCTGCSSNIVQEYLKKKSTFVQLCCQTTDGSYLEEISGLTSYRLDAAEKMVDIEGWDDDE